MTNNILQDAKILITGASSGLGLAMAEALLRAGATVALAARTPDKLHEQVKRFTAQGHNAYAVPLDVRDIRSVEAAVKWVRDTWGELDVLVNNAGIGMKTVNPRFMTNPQPFFEVTPEGFRDVIDTNLTGYFLVARGFVPLMIERGKGRIINISMNYETMKRKGFVPYGPSRAAAESLSMIMAEDLKEHGIAVNQLLPGGATETGMISEQMKKELQFPLLQPEIMADPVVFLASPAAEGITGHRIIATEFDQWLTQNGKMTL